MRRAFDKVTLSGFVEHGLKILLILVLALLVARL